MAEDGIRSSINPDDRHARKPRELDAAQPDASTIVPLLDSIPDAFERANQGLEEIRSGKGTALEDL